MIKIEVTGNSIGEVADKLLSIGASLLGSGTPSEPIKVDPVMPEVAEMAAENPTPTPKSASAAEVIESQPTTEEPSSAPAPAPSAPASAELNFEIDVAPHVLRVVKEKGKPAAQEILSQFGVEKASNLDPALWPELVEALKGAL